MEKEIRGEYLDAVSNEPTQLSHSLERLYRAFRTCPRQPELEGLIGAKDLRELGVEDIRLVWNARPTGPGEADVKHILPRVLELLIAGEYPVRPEVVLAHLWSVDWRRWQKNQQSAIEKFLVAGWRCLLSEPVPVERIDEWLCAGAQVFDRVYSLIDDQLTNEWWVTPLPKAAHYARLVSLNYEALTHRRMANPHWAGRQEQMQEAVRQLIGEYEIRQLDEIISGHPYEPVADDLRLGAYHLEELQQLPHKERTKPPLPAVSEFVREPGDAVRSGVEPIPPTSEQLEALTEATKTLYEVFEPYQAKPRSAGDLALRPLQTLTNSDLANFARDVLIAYGGPEDLKHFLPRILELMVQPGWSIRPEGVMFKMLLADYFMWPQAERDAVEANVSAVWPLLLSDPDYPVSAEEWMCGASAVIDEDLMDLPELWRTLCYDGSTPAMVHWARFVTGNCESLLDGMQLRNRFWVNRSHRATWAASWMLSARNIASYLRSESAKDGVPGEVANALECARLLWEKRGKGRRSAADVAVHAPGKSLELARRIDDPWFRCQELAYLAYNTSDVAVRDTALRESFVAGAETQEPNRVVKVSSWPLSTLADIGQSEWFRSELTRLLDVAHHEPHPFRRIDALNFLLASAFRGAPELYREVIAEIKRAADEAYGWRVAYLLLIAVDIVQTFDHEGAIEIAMMIRNLRTRRRALRYIGERELAEKQY